MTEPISTINEVTDLHTDVHELIEAINAVDTQVRHYVYDFDQLGPEAFADTLTNDLIAWALIEEARRNLAILSRDLEKVLAKSMPEKTQITPAGTFERRRKKDRTQWDREALLHDVLDTRIADPNGELIDETPLQKVLQVWNLGAPRTTVLRQRHLDPDQYCVSEDGGWSIQLSN